MRYHNKEVLNMRLAIRNKWVTLRGSSVVKDENENDVLKVQGKFFTFTRKKFIQDLDGNTKYIVRNKFWRLFAYKALICDPEGTELVRIRRKIFSLHDRYMVTTPGHDIEVKGNILGFDYHIIVDGKEVGHVSRKISLRDSFVLDIDDHYDYWFYVAFVIAIDNITDQRRNDASNSSSSY